MIFCCQCCIFLLDLLGKVSHTCCIFICICSSNRIFNFFLSSLSAYEQLIGKVTPSTLRHHLQSLTHLMNHMFMSTRVLRALRISQTVINNMVKRIQILNSKLQEGVSNQQKNAKKKAEGMIQIALTTANISFSEAINVVKHRHKTHVPYIFIG